MALFDGTVRKLLTEQDFRVAVLGSTPRRFRHFAPVNTGLNQQFRGELMEPDEPNKRLGLHHTAQLVDGERDGTRILPFVKPQPPPAPPKKGGLTLEVAVTIRKPGEPA
jgi:hypothetical protein